MGLLDQIKKENDIKQINPSDYPALAQEIREFLLEKVSKTGGHVASNFGSVELTMALHLCMDLPKDKIIFDVGHQSYTHKLLTGRREGFDTLRQLDGMSGFPKGCESDCDAFNTGHSSTSISAALGLAMAARLKREQDPEEPVIRVAAVIGDGSMTGGMAYEALDAAAQLKAPIVVILNDNEMSIDKNVGGLSRAMNRIRVGRQYNELKNDVESALMSIPSVGPQMARGIKKTKASLKNLLVPGMFFEEMGITYVGPVNGHNVEEMVSTFERAFRLRKPIIVHVKTRKGKGYPPAERHPERFHGIGPFDPETGEPREVREKTFTDVFAKTLLNLGETNPKVVAITAAMARGTGIRAFQKAYPDRTFDVGIAEQHAVTFAAGLAKAGLVPIVAIYSSFLQRAYDQILHDVCLQKLHVVFAIDRSGLVGEDGETHHGIYDTAYLDEMPGLTVLSPKNGAELKLMLEFAVGMEGPVAVKYPRGSSMDVYGEKVPKIVYGKSLLVYDSETEALQQAIRQDEHLSGTDEKKLSEDEITAEKREQLADVVLSMQGNEETANEDTGAEPAKTCITFVAVGNMNQPALEAAKRLTAMGHKTRVVDARFLRPLDEEMLTAVMEDSKLLVILEESVSHGSFGEAVSYLLLKRGISLPFLHVCIKEDVVTHGSVKELRKRLGLDTDSIVERTLEKLNLLS